MDDNDHFIERIERSKEAFKQTMCLQVDHLFGMFISEIKFRHKSTGQRALSREHPSQHDSSSSIQPDRFNGTTSQQLQANVRPASNSGNRKRQYFSNTNTEPSPSQSSGDLSNSSFPSTAPFVPSTEPSTHATANCQQYPLTQPLLHHSSESFLPTLPNEYLNTVNNPGQKPQSEMGQNSLPVSDMVKQEIQNDHTEQPIHGTIQNTETRNCTNMHVNESDCDCEDCLDDSGDENEILESDSGESEEADDHTDHHAQQMSHPSSSKGQIMQHSNHGSHLGSSFLDSHTVSTLNPPTGQYKQSSKRMRITPSKKLLCDIPGCGKMFRTPSELTAHQWAHSGLKPYHCAWPDCRFRSEHRHNTIQHIRRTHFKLPKTVKEQMIQMISDDRDPNQFIVVKFE